MAAGAVLAPWEPTDQLGSRNAVQLFGSLVDHTVRQGTGVAGQRKLGQCASQSTHGMRSFFFCQRGSCCHNALMEPLGGSRRPNRLASHRISLCSEASTSGSPTRDCGAWRSCVRPPTPLRVARRAPPCRLTSSWGWRAAQVGLGRWRCLGTGGSGSAAAPGGAASMLPHPHSLPLPPPADDKLLERHPDTQRFLQVLETLDQPPADAAPDRLATAGLFRWEVRWWPALLQDLSACVQATAEVYRLPLPLARPHRLPHVPALPACPGGCRMRCLWRGLRGGSM